MSDPNQPTHVTVTVYGARDLYDTNFVHSMNPYCIVTMGGHQHQTQVDVRGGKTPCWHQTFRMDYAGERTMRFKLMDKDKVSKDDMIAIGDVALEPIVHGPRLLNTELELTRGEKKAGYLRVTIEFEPRSKETSKKTAASKTNETSTSSTPAPAPAIAPTPVVVATPASPYATPVYGTAPAYAPPTVPYPAPAPVYAAPAPQPYAPPPYGSPAAPYGAVPQAYSTPGPAPYYPPTSAPTYYPYRPS